MRTIWGSLTQISFFRLFFKIFSTENDNQIALPGVAILFQVDESGVTRLCLWAFLRRRNDKMDSHTHGSLITAPASNL